jgi:hypothetical protein
MEHDVINVSGGIVIRKWYVNTNVPLKLLLDAEGEKPRKVTH